jgi:hypothetical protein
MRKLLIVIIVTLLLCQTFTAFAAIDTRDKRASVINLLLPFGRVLPTPGQ